MAWPLSAKFCVNFLYRENFVHLYDLRQENVFAIMEPPPGSSSRLIALLGDIVAQAAAARLPS
ncbi:MAG TPA: hypothetical protein VF482_16035, partial [Trebonia sp.]